MFVLWESEIKQRKNFENLLVVMQGIVNIKKNQLYFGLRSTKIDSSGYISSGRISDLGSDGWWFKSAYPDYRYLTVRSLVDILCIIR